MMSSLDQISSIVTKTGVSVFTLAVDGSRDYPPPNTTYPPPNYVPDAPTILSTADIDKSVNNFFAVKLLQGFREQAAGVLFVNVLGNIKGKLGQTDTYHDKDCLGADFPLVQYPCSVDTYVKAASSIFLIDSIDVNNGGKSAYSNNLGSASGVRMLISHMCLVACSLWQNLENYATDQVTRVATKTKALQAMRSQNWIIAQRFIWNGSWTKNLADELLGLYIKLIYISTDMSVAGQPLPDGSAAFDGTHVVDLYNAVWDVCLNVTGEDPVKYMVPYDFPILEDAIYQVALKTFTRKSVLLWEACINHVMPTPDEYMNLSATEVFNLPRNPNGDAHTMLWLQQLWAVNDGTYPSQLHAGDQSVRIFDNPPRPAAYTSMGKNPSYVPTIVSQIK